MPGRHWTNCSTGWAIDSEAEINRDQAHHLLQYVDTHLALVSADREEQERVVDRLAEHVLVRQG